MVIFSDKCPFKMSWQVVVWIYGIHAKDSMHGYEKSIIQKRSSKFLKIQVDTNKSTRVLPKNLSA